MYACFTSYCSMVLVGSFLIIFLLSWHVYEETVLKGLLIDMLFFTCGVDCLASAFYC